MFEGEHKVRPYKGSRQRSRLAETMIKVNKFLILNNVRVELERLESKSLDLGATPTSKDVDSSSSK